MSVPPVALHIPLVSGKLPTLQRLGTWRSHDPIARTLTETERGYRNSAQGFVAPRKLPVVARSCRGTAPGRYFQLRLSVLVEVSPQCGTARDHVRRGPG